MDTARITTLSDLDARLAAQAGWIVVHVGIALHSRHARTSLAFDQAHLLRDESDALDFVRLELSPVDAVHCSLAFGATPFVHLYRDGERLESMPAPASEAEVSEWLDFVLSFHD